jgi:hypothetical protein
LLHDLIYIYAFASSGVDDKWDFLMELRKVAGLIAGESIYGGIFV